MPQRDRVALRLNGSGHRQEAVQRPPNWRARTAGYAPTDGSPLLPPAPERGSPPPPGWWVDTNETAASPPAPQGTPPAPEGCSDRPGPVSPVHGRWCVPGGREGYSDHPVRWTPRPPPGRCAPFMRYDASPWATTDTPTTLWAGIPVPPGPVCPVIRR